MPSMEGNSRGRLRTTILRCGERCEDFLARLLREPERARRVYPWVLLALTLLVWFPTLFTGLDLSNPDDYYHITQAALYHSPSDVTTWFTRGHWAYSHYEYRPLTRLAVLVTYLMWGPRPFGFHLASVLLHFACALLLSAAMVRAGAPVWPARLAGLVAAVFPAGQMAVSWISGMGDLLCNALILSSVLVFLQWLQGQSWRWAVGASALTILAALTKEPGAATPAFLLLAALVLPSRRGWPERIGAVALSVGLLLPYLWVRFHAWSFDEYVAVNALILRPLSVSVRYLFSDLLLPRPYELVAFWWPMGWHVVLAQGFPKMLLEQVVFWIALPLLCRRRLRLLMLGVAWKIVFFLPAYQLYWNPAFTHYRYLPHLGTAWIVGLAAWELGESAARRLRSRTRPLVRWSLVAAGLAALLAYYIVQLPLRWPSLSTIADGGPPPPPAFCRALQGPGVPFRLDDSDLHPPVP